MFITLILLFSRKIAAQDLRNETRVKLFEKAEAFKRERKFFEAEEIYNKIIKKEPKQFDAYFKAYGLLKLIGEKDKALFYAEELIKKNPSEEKYNPLFAEVAEWKWQSGKYELAKKYIELLLTKQLDADSKKVYSSYKNKYEVAIFNVSNPITIKIKKVKWEDDVSIDAYFPVLTADEENLIFTSRDNAFDENIFQSELLNNNTWSKPNEIKELKTLEREGTNTISADGRIMVFTFCGKGYKRKNLGSCDLYYSIRNGDKWSTPINLGKEINTKYWESQPSLSADGRALFFSSDRPGGMGKKDIWLSKKNESGEWSKAENLGQEINTSEDDIAPFIHANGESLFFSSSGRHGLGGYDLYFSINNGSSWSEVKSLPHPINDYNNQIGIYINPSLSKAYYSIDSKNFSELVYFDLPASLDLGKKAGYLKGRVRDADTKRLIPSFLELTSKNKLIFSCTSDSLTGNYLMVIPEGNEYALHISKKGYFFQSVKVDYKNVLYLDTLVRNIDLVPIQKNKKVVLNNIYFDFGSAEILETSKTELLKLLYILKNTPDVKIHFEAHTDDVGSKENNLLLSEKRAKSVVEYLTTNGILESRLSWSGEGENKPLVPNTSDYKRSLNRRIEFMLK